LGLFKGSVWNILLYKGPDEQTQVCNELSVSNSDRGNGGELFCDTIH
jgi:hypothetical protein